MKFTEALKLENFNAHYKSIMGNIVVANNELSIAVAEKEKHKKEAAILAQANIEAQAKLDAIISKSKQIILEQENKIANATSMLEKANKAKIDADEYVSTTISDFAQTKDAAIKEINELTESIQNLSEQEAQLTSTISTLHKQVLDMTSDIKDLNKTISNLRKDETGLISSIDTHTITHTKLIEKHTKELDLVKKELIENRSKIVDVNKHLEKEKKDIARREKDILIVTRRLKELFQQVRPGTALKL